MQLARLLLEIGVLTALAHAGHGFDPTTKIWKWTLFVHFYPMHTIHCMYTKHACANALAIDARHHLGSLWTTSHECKAGKEDACSMVQERVSHMASLYYYYEYLLPWHSGKQSSRTSPKSLLYATVAIKALLLTFTTHAHPVWYWPLSAFR